MKTILKTYYRDGQFLDSGDEMRDEGSATYDVLRVVGGRPLFLEAHVQRLNDCLLALGYEPRDDIPEILAHLIAKNGGDMDCNVKILAGKEYDLVMGFIKSTYPDESQYEKGVSLVTVDVERKDPIHKIWKDDYKGYIAQVVQEKQAFEALLVNKRGEVTEGSKSNVFFIRGQRVLTPATGALPGVTKRYVEATILKMGMVLEKISIKKKDIFSMDAAFLTGTSLHILPVSSIDAIPYDAKNLLLCDLMQEFQKTRQQDLDKSMQR